MVVVSISTSTDYLGEQNALIEDQGTALTVSFELDEAAPAGGLKVFVDSDVEQIVNRLDLVGFGTNPTVENINPNLLGTSFDNSGFFLTIDEGATTASFTINVFDNDEPDTFLPETFDGLVEANFSLVAPGEVAQEDLADVGNLGDYTINPDAASTTVIFADEESQLTDTPEPPTENPTEPPASGLPLVSLNTGPDYLVEADGNVSAHVFNVTQETIPENGLLVGVSAPNLSEFNLDAIEVSDGGEIVNVRSDGFDIRLDDFTVLLDIPVAADGEAEGLETARFSLEAGDGYEVNEGFSSGSFSIVDTADELPVNTSNRNDIIPLARDIGLSAENPEVTITEELGFSIGNRYENEDGSFTYVDETEDVDFYKVELEEGDIVSFDIDATVANDSLAEFARDLNPGNTNLQLFNEQGEVLVSRGIGQGPNELFVSEADAFIEYQATKDGTYYLGVSVFDNGVSYRFGGDQFGDPALYAERAYDPFTPASGDALNAYIWAGEYDLNVILNPENPVIYAEQQNRSNNSPPETVDIPEPGEPTVSLDFLTGIYDPEDNVTGSQLIEGLPNQGSILTLVVNVDGEIPEEGILVDLNSDIYLRDYFTVRSLIRPPFTPGAETVDILTDDTGRETGLQLRIFEPATYLPLNAKTVLRGDRFLPETDGPEEATFFLEGGEGYGVSETGSQITTTFYDSLEQAPEPSIIPEVSLSISETELIESEQTATTLNFSLNEPPPEEGVLLHVKSDNAGILPQFEVLTAEVEGGVFPFPNFDFSGFFFKATEQNASITVTTFADPFEEGLQSYNFALQETPLYTINEDASEVNFTIADNPDSVLEVSLSAESEAVVESENESSVLTFNLTAIPPEGGVSVTVEADNLSEFNTDELIVTGGEITDITDTGFTLNITDVTATVELPTLSDNQVEEPKTANFSLVGSPEYLIAPEAGEIAISVVDIPEQVPSPTEESDTNDTIAEAIKLNLNSQNPNATISATLTGREPSQSGQAAGTDFSEDVDFYTFELETGDTVKLDIDTVSFAPEVFGFTFFDGVEQRTDAELRLFDANGNELATASSGAAPDEEFSRDPYLEFTAEETGQYYVGISQLGNLDYDPNVEGSGSGWVFPEIGVFAGEYDLNVELVSGGVDEPTFEPVFGSIDGDTIEVSGSNQLIFAGDMNDLVDASISSEGSNRIYAGSGDDTVILGMSDRIVGGEGADKFFATTGGDNILTGGAGADQFWIATAETPDAANIITDFTSGEDVLGIAGLGIGFDDLSITQQEDNTLIAANGSDLAILQGIGADSLIIDNFAFV